MGMSHDYQVSIFHLYLYLCVYVVIWVHNLMYKCFLWHVYLAVLLGEKLQYKNASFSNGKFAITSE